MSVLSIAMVEGTFPATEGSELARNRSVYAKNMQVRNMAGSRHARDMCAMNMHIRNIHARNMTENSHVRSVCLTNTYTGNMYAVNVHVGAIHVRNTASNTYARDTHVRDIHVRGRGRGCADASSMRLGLASSCFCLLRASAPPARRWDGIPRGWRARAQASLPAPHSPGGSLGPCCGP